MDNITPIEIFYDNKIFTNQDKFNRYLLIKYLRLEFISKKATPKQATEATKKLMEKNAPNLFGKGGLAYTFAESHLEFFCLYFLQNTFIPKSDNVARNLAQVHLDIWNELQKMFIEDKYDKEEFILPRGCSKSTIINKALSCYLHCYKKSIYTIVIGNKEADAVQFIADTRKMLENPFIVGAFGVLVDRKFGTLNKQEIVLGNKTKIQAFSWGSSVRGTTYGNIDGIYRPTTIICDDVLSEDDILTDQAKEKVLNKFYKEISESGDAEVIRNNKKIKSGTKFLVIGTPLCSDDFINSIKTDVTFKVFHRKVVNFDVDDYFENNTFWQHYKKLLFNDKLDKEDKDILLKEYYTKFKLEMEFTTIWEKYQCDELARKYFSKRTAFMQELMCDCQNVGAKWFTTIKAISTSEMNEHSFIKTMLICDPASSTTEKSDYSSIIVGSIATNEFAYIRKGIIIKLPFLKLCDKIVAMIKEYPDVTHVSIEKNLYVGTDVIKIQELMAKDTELSHRRITFINNMQHRNKDEKISTIIEDVNNGTIIFNEEDKEFTEQIKTFAGQKYTQHDDAIDNVSQFMIDVKEIVVNRHIKLLDRRLLGL